MFLNKACQYEILNFTAESEDFTSIYGCLVALLLIRKQKVEL